MSEILNAKIERTKLGFDRGTFLCAWLYMDYGDSGHQGFGGVVLAKKGCFESEVQSFGINCISEILSVLEVEEWDKIKGLYCRVKKGDGFQGEIEAIGHITKNKWFRYDDVMDKTMGGRND